MSEKTYTAAEVAVMLAAERAKTTRSKDVRIYVDSGSFKPKVGPRKGLDTPFCHIKVEGSFKPTSVSFSVAEAIVSNFEAFKAALNQRPKTEAPTALSTDTAPRLAKQ